MYLYEYVARCSIQSPAPISDVPIYRCLSARLSSGCALNKTSSNKHRPPLVGARENMKPTASSLLQVAALIGGVSGQRLLRQDVPPVPGVTPTGNSSPSFVPGGGALKVNDQVTGK